MFEALLNKSGRAQGPVPDYSGPGPQDLQGSYTDPGDTNKIAGFYGELTSASFITPTALATACGLTTGVMINNTTAWLKFLLDGKILFIPKLPIRYNTSWQDLYAKGVVYGDDTIGAFPFPTTSPITQNTKVTIGGVQYRVRLIRGSNADPGTRSTTDDEPGHIGSEWNRLIYPISVITKTPNNQIGPKFMDSPYAATALGFNSSTGSMTMCLETTNGTLTAVVVRGFASVTGSTYGNKAGMNDRGGWRPVLELINPVVP